MRKNIGDWSWIVRSEYACSRTCNIILCMVPSFHTVHVQFREAINCEQHQTGSETFGTVLLTAKAVFRQMSTIGDDRMMCTIIIQVFIQVISALLAFSSALALFTASIHLLPCCLPSRGTTTNAWSTFKCQCHCKPPSVKELISVYNLQGILRWESQSIIKHFSSLNAHSSTGT